MASTNTSVKTIAPPSAAAGAEKKEEKPKVVVIPEKLSKSQKRRIKKFQAKKIAKAEGKPA